jgi:hypothetical protein
LGVAVRAVRRDIGVIQITDNSNGAG